MIFATIFSWIELFLLLLIWDGLIYLFVLIVKALQKYISSGDIHR